MSRSNRGAAQVSLMWVIAFAVIGLGSLGYAFIMDSELTKALNGLDVAQNESTQFQTENTALRNELRGEVSELGFAAENADRVNLERVSADKEALIAAFGIDGTNIRTFSDIKDPLVSAYTGVVNERDLLKGQVAQLRGDLAAREAASRSAIADKDATIATLRREKEDQLTQSSQQILDLERQRDALRGEYADLQSQIAELRVRNDEAMRQLSLEMGVLKQRNDILSSRLNSVARRADSPDGSVLSVAGEIGRAWIDRGTMDRVTIGMEFDVRNANSGARKGRLRIVSVAENRSEAQILEQTDRFDPIRTDDVIVNPVYDPERQPVAVLLGNGFGRYNAADMKAMLAEVGVMVREDISAETDILLLGTPFFDEDTGEVVPWESRDEYKAAASFSVQVIPLRDWTQWLGR